MALKVLFVSSGNNKFGISPIIKSQGLSLEKEGVEVEYFTIKGRGMGGYIKSIPRLKRYVNKNNFDLIHAHYSLSAFVASFVSGLPLVVSLMGSDTQVSVAYKLVIRMFYVLRWKSLIVKSESMKKSISIKKANIIPNGVDFRAFKPLERNPLRKKFNLLNNKKYVLFLADPSRYAKNFPLAESAFNLIKREDIELKVVYHISHKSIPEYLNAFDVLLLTSRWEGSPNVIKESMACNMPIVATDVGDVSEVIGSTEGCFVTGLDEYEISECLQKAIEFDGRTSGRSNIKHLDSKVIANKLISIYKEVLN
ncbi:MAG: glycosyltransferase family 4 protein [Bacteroidetes bacterium]|nr:glycosyltransferase family 4 protein [Bacteroidota bacterium]